MRFLGGVREGGASGHHMSTFVAVETESFLGTLFMFFWSEFLGEFNHVNIYGIGVFGGSRRRGKRLQGLSGPSTSLSDLFGTVPLVLEVSSLQVPVINFVWDCI